MKTLIKVVNIYYQEQEDREYPTVQSGLVLELEDGRFLTHSQDGFVQPFAELQSKETNNATK